MANTAINHDPVATFPGSSTNTAVVKWSGTSGNALLDSGITIDASNNLTIPGNITTTGYVHLTGDTKELRFYENGNFIAIKAPSLGADYTLTLPINDGAASEFLQTDGNGVLVWAAVHADAHTVVSHSDTTITGAELTQLSGISANVTDTNLNTLTDGSSTTSLHAHAGGGPSQASVDEIRGASSNLDSDTGSNVDKYIPPDLLQKHYGVAKAWAMVAAAGTLNTPSYNIDSITDTGTGNRLVIFEIDFAIVQFNVHALSDGIAHMMYAERTAVGSSRFYVQDNASTPNNQDAYTGMVYFGNQA